MLNTEQLLQFSQKYEDELAKIDNEIELLKQKRVIALAKVEVAKDFIALENSFCCSQPITEETVEEDISMGEEITYQGGSLWLKHI